MRAALQKSYPVLSRDVLVKLFDPGVVISFRYAKQCSTKPGLGAAKPSFPYICMMASTLKLVGLLSSGYTSLAFSSQVYIHCPSICCALHIMSPFPFHVCPNPRAWINSCIDVWYTSRVFIFGGLQPA